MFKEALGKTLDFWTKSSKCCDYPGSPSSRGPFQESTSLLDLRAPLPLTLPALGQGYSAEHNLRACFKWQPPTQV